MYLGPSHTLRPEPGSPATTAGAGLGAEETPAAAAGAGEHIVFPAPVTGVAAEAPRSGTPAPANIQVFEDGEAAAPALPSAALSSKPSAAAPGGFRIQVLSVSSKSEAESEAARLSKRGFSARVEPGTGPRGTVFRVRVGPYSTREEAARVSQKLAAEGRRDTWIVPPGQ